MKLIIKGKQFKLPEDLKEFAELKIRKFEKRIPENSIVEMVFEDANGPKGGIDKIVHLDLILPDVKNPIYFSAKSEDFKKSVNLIEEKFKREIEEYKEKRKHI
jgi:ribosomal subunit interface protein